MEARLCMAAMPITEAQHGTAHTALTDTTGTAGTAPPLTMAQTDLPRGTAATQQTETITRAEHIRMRGVEQRHTRPTARTELCTLGAVVTATSLVRPITTGLLRLPLAVRPITAARILANVMWEARPPVGSTGEAPRAVGGTTTAGPRERRVAVVGEVCTPAVSMAAAVFDGSRFENRWLGLENRHVDWE